MGSAISLTQCEDLFDMANLSPQRTGLPFVVFISQRGGARHDVRVKVGRSAKAIPHEMTTVALRPEIAVIDGTIPREELDLLKRWIALNHDVIVKYWDGDIEYTEDAIAAIRPVQ